MDRAEWLLEIEDALKEGKMLSPPVCLDLVRLVRQRDALLEAMKSIAANTCCDNCREAAVVAQRCLTKLNSPQAIAASKLAEVGRG